MRTYVIGRSNDGTVDIVLDHNSVSRRHAELTIADDGRFYLADLSSTNGTSVLVDGNWRELRQGYVVDGALVAFGEHHITIGQLLKLAGNNGRIDPPPPSTLEPPANPTNPPVASPGRIRRNPTTGEVIKPSRK
jgi:pSer/pThr/pTyr-binding forkhead associated (FHA) protein